MKQKMAQEAINKRVQKSREKRKRAGLKRVEVFVPANKAALVKAYAAQIREGSNSEKLVQVRKLIAKAYRGFHARCLDNIQIDPENAQFSDAAVVAAALMHRGNAEAFKLGKEISKLAR